jgi:hypothetical protein
MSDRTSAEATATEVALQALGLVRPVDWDHIRSTYRSRIRAAHPDIDGANASATASAARLNWAFDVLANATEQGRRPLPDPQPVVTPVVGRRPRAEVASTSPITLRAGPGDVFVQLLEAAHEIGDVSYMDPEAGLIQVLLESGDPTASQLLIAVDRSVEPPTASFTLDTQDGAHAPPIQDIVDELAAALIR